MPEAKIGIVPGTTKPELLIASPTFGKPGRTITAYPYSTDELMMAAIRRLEALGLHKGDTQTKLGSGETIKW